MKPLLWLLSLEAEQMGYSKESVDPYLELYFHFKGQKTKGQIGTPTTAPITPPKNKYKNKSIMERLGGSL